MRPRVFASHDWGKGGATHARVRTVVDLLKPHVDVWFDEERMHGNILDCMCDGIDNADVVLVFVTNEYIRKVQHGNNADNVRREFMYAQTRNARMIAVRFDTDLPRVWPGPVGMMLGCSLFVDMSSSEVTQSNVDALVALVHKQSTQHHLNTVITAAQAAVKVQKPRDQTPSTKRVPMLALPSRASTPRRAASPRPATAATAATIASTRRAASPRPATAASTRRAVSPRSGTPNARRALSPRPDTTTPRRASHPGCATGTRTRIKRLMHKAEMVPKDGEHMSEMLNRLLLSIGANSDVKSLMFEDRLQRAEEELSM